MRRSWQLPRRTPCLMSTRAPPPAASAPPGAHAALATLLSLPGFCCCQADRNVMRHQQTPAAFVRHKILFLHMHWMSVCKAWATSTPTALLGPCAPSARLLWGAWYWRCFCTHKGAVVVLTAKLFVSTTHACMPIPPVSRQHLQGVAQSDCQVIRRRSWAPCTAARRSRLPQFPRLPLGRYWLPAVSFRPSFRLLQYTKQKSNLI